MSKITPIGYSRKRIGVFLAIAIVIGAVFLMNMFVMSGASFADIKYFGIVAVVLSVLCIFSDVTSNMKNRKKILHMEYMLSCPVVKGEVIEIRRIPFYFGKEFPKHPHIYPMGKNVVYRIVVSFENPVTGMEEKVVSEKYGENVDLYIKEKCVKVHYSPNGEYWIEI
ncbi:MAG: hypothetical protein J6K37_06175 [Lachnospiraceae bacterium]|nr:hypothetical protein [Lachnospiraceae bacterium]